MDPRARTNCSARDSGLRIDGPGIDDGIRPCSESSLGYGTTWTLRLLARGSQPHRHPVTPGSGSCDGRLLHARRGAHCSGSITALRDGAPPGRSDKSESSRPSPPSRWRTASRSRRPSWDSCAFRSAGRGGDRAEHRVRRRGDRAGAQARRRTARAPWIVDSGFGLLHGFGFAGALSGSACRRAHSAGAAVLQLGVEVGQLLFVGGVLSCRRRIRRLTDVACPRWCELVPPYGIGTSPCSGSSNASPLLRMITNQETPHEKSARRFRSCSATPD